MKPISLDLIRTDGGTQMRAELSQDVYLDYRDKWLAGVEFDPVEVFHDGATYWLADGFHRFYGAKEAKRSSIQARVHNGTQRDAILFAAGANASHGLRRTNADKRQAVLALLNDPEWVTWSDNRIAEQAAVNQSTVSAIRKELMESISSPAAKAAGSPRVGRDGKARKPPRKAMKPAATREPGEDAPDPAHDDTIRDALGGNVPAKLREVFDAVTPLRGIVSRIGGIRSDLQQLQAKPGGAAIPLTEAERLIDELQRAVKFSTPHTECPKCRRKLHDKCKACHGHGWVTEPTFDRCKTKDDELWLANRK